MIDDFRQLIRYRTLIRALVARHLAVRYRGSVLGFLWSFLNPLCLMLVYTLVFRYYIRFEQVENYTIFLFCGLLPWLWMSSGLLESTGSVVGSGHLITKSMFPAQILPTVSVLTSMVHFLFSLPLLVLFMIIAEIPLRSTILLVPIAIALQFLLLLGLGLVLSALNVYFRDVQHLVANVLTFLFFLCPILYPPKLVPPEFRFTIDYNPFAQLTVVYQELILEGVLPSVWSLSCILGAAVLSLLIGTWVFRAYREGFAEML